MVHIASESAHLPDPPIVDYAAAKAALLSLSKALATEFGSREVRSNVVSPGPTGTRLWDALGGFADQLAEQFGLVTGASAPAVTRPWLSSGESAAARRSRAAGDLERAPGGANLNRAAARGCDGSLESGVARLPRRVRVPRW